MSKHDHVSAKPKPNPQIQPVADYAGTIKSFQVNRNAVYDSFLFITPLGEQTVSFPPHAGERLLELVQPGQSVTLTATQQKGKPHENKTRLHLISISVQGETIHILPPDVSPDQLVETRQPIASLEYTDKGHLHAIRLADDTQLLFPPHVGQQLADRIQNGDTVTAWGWPKALRPGEKRADVHPPLQLHQLTTSEARLLVR